VGGSSLALAALALIPAAFAGRRHRRAALGWLILGLVGLLVAAHFPWISRPFGWLPFLRDTLLKRLSLWWVIAASVLAAMGARNLLRGRGRAAVLGGILALAVLLAVVGGFFPSSRAPLPAAMGWLQLLILIPLCVWMFRRWTPILLLLVLLVPRMVLFKEWVPLSLASSFYPSTPAVEFVKERSQGFRVGGLGPALIPHSAAFFGLEDVRGYDPLAFAPYVEFSKTFSRLARPGWGRIERWDHPALDFLGVKFLFDHPTMYIFHHPGALQVYEGEDALVFENPGAFRRLFRPASVEVVASPEAALAKVPAIEDFGALALASGEGLPAPGTYPNGEMEISGLEVAPGRLAAEVEAGSLAVVATSQPAIPGWRLWLDGLEVEPLRVDGAFLGALVETGRHELVFRYAPRSWTLGWLLFSLGIVGSCVILGAARK
ncbi:MAG: YfhO family protein, partial [Acidobacteria bacterium]|nr:YfhO family protein [Acidobacteriota bacterium]